MQTESRKRVFHRESSSVEPVLSVRHTDCPGRYFILILRTKSRPTASDTL